MAKKFHVAMFCSECAYIERQTFYSSTFGAPSSEGPINEGAENHICRGSIWGRQDGFIFALLIDRGLTGSAEKLAHVGFIFDNDVEFNAEIQRRGIGMEKVKVFPAGHKQVFVRDADDPALEWEFTFQKPADFS